MKRISALFIHRIVAIATGNDPIVSTTGRSLFQSIGLPPEASVDHKRMITDKAFYSLFERIAYEEPIGRSIAIRVGASMRCDDYGAFGLAFKSALTLWGSFQRVERYGKVVTNIANFEVIPGSDTALMAVIPDTETRLGLKMTNELAVAAATAISREVCQFAFKPVAVHFAHEAPNDISDYDAHFGCPVHFEAERDGLEISHHFLYMQNRLGDLGLSEFFDTHLEKELTEIEPESGLIQKVHTQITHSLSEGIPTISTVAERLGMSGRSLQRRLSEQGYAYQDIADTARRNLAEHLLHTTEYSLSEIAFLTGFSEQSAFSRAFKRWHGQTPRAFRIALLAPGH